MSGSLHNFIVNNQVAFRCVFVYLPQYMIYQISGNIPFGQVLVDWVVCSQ